MKRICFIPVWFAALLSAGLTPAAAQTLPWLEDPFGGREKVAIYGTRLKPEICPPMPEDKTALTLTQLVNLSLCYNPDTKTAFLSLMNSADTYASSYSAYLPTISSGWSRSRSRNFSRAADGKNSISGDSDGSISASMTLYDFGQRELGIEAAELSLTAAGLSYDTTLQSAIAGAIRSYYSLLTAQNAVEVATASNLFAKQSFEAAELRHQLGLVPLADKLQATVAYSQSQLSLQQAENNLAITRGSVARLLGMPVDAALGVAEIDDSNLTSDPFGGNVQRLIDVAKNERTDLKGSRASLKAAEIALKRTKRSNLATISATAGMGYDTVKVFSDDASRSQSIGISVSIPIFTGFTQTYNTRIAETGILSQQESLKATELGVEQEVWSAWHNYENAKKNWEISWDQLASATQLRDVTLGRYKEGLGTILDVLNAQSSYRGALQSHLTTRLALLTSRVDLIRAVGALNLDTIEPTADSAAGAAATQPAE
ncbi:MAG: TolC family protein [Alphaproteobacteria bacterium]|nr:TolC family protein [Alphaproteobacteria bacterium]